jgi:hypothetical protein
VETFFFYTFIAVVFLVISGFVLAFIFGLYMGWQAPPPIDFRDESYGQLSLPELKRLSGIEFRQEMTESELEIKLLTSNQIRSLKLESSIHIFSLQTFW